MNIVMLNLLISILSNTFEQVMSVQKSDDLRQVCRILIEDGELFGELYRFILRIANMHEAKERSAPKYLHMFTEIGHRAGCLEDEEEDEWTGRIKFLQTQIERVETNIRRELQDEVKELTARQSAISHHQDQMNGKIDEILAMIEANNTQEKAI